MTFADCMALLAVFGIFVAMARLTRQIVNAMDEMDRLDAEEEKALAEIERCVKMKEEAKGGGENENSNRCRTRQEHGGQEMPEVAGSGPDKGVDAE